jgi:hypothetical protein
MFGCNKDYKKDPNTTHEQRVEVKASLSIIGAMQFV